MLFRSFNPKDLIYVETDIEISDLRDADFVIAKNINEKYAIFRQIVIGEIFEDKYLKVVNLVWPDQDIIPLDQEYELIGKVISKYVTYV